MPVLDDVRRAAHELGARVHRTPLVSSRTLSERSGCRVLLKLENLQKTGSFKARGALNHLLRLLAERKVPGVVSISAGNHAQALAYAAGALGVPATLVMMHGASEAKLAATRDYGAEIIMAPDAVTGFEMVQQLERERGLYFLHPFDHPWTVAGAGTVGLEIFEDCPEASHVLVGVGGGGLISGVAVALEGLGSGTRVIGVEPEGADGMSQALAAGKVVRLESPRTVADGLAAPFAGELNLDIVRRWVERVVTVSDPEILAAARLLLERTKLLAEPAAAAPVAALLSGRLEGLEGKTVVCIISGGNVSREMLLQVLAD